MTLPYAKHVEMMLTEQDLSIVIPPEAKTRNERDRRMCRLYVKGYTFKDIGKLYHIRGESVHEIFRLIMMPRRARGKDVAA